MRASILRTPSIFTRYAFWRRVLCPDVGRVPADYDGDGSTDVSVYRPSTGQWFRIQSTAGFGVLNWGEPTDEPVPADYDGDGKADVTIFRPSNATWYAIGSTAGILVNPFGQTGDLPTPGAFIY
ncbi:MAG: VCBS repeat-containing protein [Pyrinomonadaceae bacterium]